MSSNAPAPGDLELVRAFLNTWEVPNDTRAPVDRLDALAADIAAWEEALPGLAWPGSDQIDELKHLRESMREALGRTHPTQLAAQLRRHPLRAELQEEAAGRSVALRPVTPSGAAELLARVVTAVGDGHWHRLKECPDCRYVFYDVTRNASRTWCAMSPETPQGRGCGGIAKARAHRARTRSARR